MQHVRNIDLLVSLFALLVVIYSFPTDLSGKRLEIPPRPSNLQEDTTSQSEKNFRKDKIIKGKFTRKQRIVESLSHVILPGDEVILNLKNQYWGGTHDVSEKGIISLRYVGKLKVAGRRLRSIKRQLSKRLEKYFYQPSLDVKVKTNRKLTGGEPSENSIYVAGEVREPGLINVDKARSLSEIVEIFGGFTKKALTKNVRILRANGGLTHGSLDSTSLGSESNQITKVRPGDFVYVPKSQETKERTDEIFIAGAVKQPRQVKIGEPVTLGVALSKSTNGFQSNALREEVLITRTNGETHTVNAKNQLAYGNLSQSERVYINPGDYIYVPSEKSQQVSVTVLGQVGSPSLIRLSPDQGVMDAVVKAGSIGTNSKLDQIHVFRKDEGETQVLSASYHRYVQGDLSQNFSLKDDDVVYVGTNFFPRIDTLRDLLRHIGFGTGAVQDVEQLRNIEE